MYSPRCSSTEAEPVGGLPDPFVDVTQPLLPSNAVIFGTAAKLVALDGQWDDEPSVEDLEEIVCRMFDTFKQLTGDASSGLALTPRICRLLRDRALAIPEVDYAVEVAPERPWS